MKFINTQTFNFEGAFRGMRNPKNSWAKSDSTFTPHMTILGPKDLKLAQTLIKAGPEHRKFLRQIMVCVDITAPLYWWKELDTYKVGTTANSTSTMHKLADTKITRDCFEMGDYDSSVVVFDEELYYVQDAWCNLISICEGLRVKYNQTKEERYWKELIRLLPESFLQTRTVTMNYENLYSMYRQRKSHKLIEWRESFVNWVKTLPYANELILLDD